MAEEGKAEALRRIAEAREAGDDKLNLHQLKLTELPREILTLPGLKLLGVSDNPLSGLPDWLEQLEALEQLRALRCGLRTLPETLPARLQALNLSLNELEALPPAVTRLRTLQHLRLVGNRLQALPPAIGQLHELTHLDVTANLLTTLPATLAQLARLQRLDLTDNALATLPAVVGEIEALRWLDIGANGIEQLPATLGALHQLATLKLNLNPLRALPDAVGALAGLRKLSLTHGKLAALPNSLCTLDALEHLDVAANELTALPANIGALAALRWLDVSHNRLRALPGSLQQLDGLQTLFLHGNDDLGLPREVLGATELETAEPARPSDILTYYFRTRDDQDQQPLLEAKMLVLGQGGVGKTSLVNRLVDDRFDAHEAKTEGIAIRRWPLPGRGSGETIQVNVWDFGGQEIFYDTHQFFLTKRSLYLVVISARQGEQEGRLRRWLDLVRSYGGGSPVLVVVNRSDEHTLQLDTTRLHADYPQLIGGVFDVSAKDGGARMARLRDAVGEAIRGMKAVYDPVPRSFFRVKAQLQQWADARDFVDIDEYRALCEEHGIVKRQEQEALIRLLHRLGSVLHFNDPGDPYQLKETKVLNPAWVTRGIYQLLGSARLALQGGELTPEDLPQLLDADSYPPKRHPFLLEMMRKFELLFDFPDQRGSRMLVPKLLPPAEPDLDWSRQDSLNFRYHCRVLPEGILPRFIVQMHHRLGDRPTYWRSGVVLRIGDQRVLVRGDAHNGRIHIAVQGPRVGRRRALSIVRDRFEAIFATIAALPVEAMVPLPGRPDVVVPYQELLDHLALGVEHMVKDGRKVAVRELLAGIEEPERATTRPPPSDKRSPQSPSARKPTTSEQDADKPAATTPEPPVSSPSAGAKRPAAPAGEGDAATDSDALEGRRLNATVKLVRELLIGMVVLGLLLAGLERLVSATMFPWVLGFIAAAMLVLVVFVWRRMRDISETGALDMLKHTVDKGSAIVQGRRAVAALPPAETEAEAPDKTEAEAPEGEGS